MPGYLNPLSVKLSPRINHLTSMRETDRISKRLILGLKVDGPLIGLIVDSRSRRTLFFLHLVIRLTIYRSLEGRMPSGACSINYSTIRYTSLEIIFF